MEQTSADGFRATLREWMEKARQDPIRILRKNGEMFVLMTFDEFEKTQIELAELRGIAKGLSDVVQGRVKPAYPTSHSKIIEKVKQRVLAERKKRVVGQ